MGKNTQKNKKVSDNRGKTGKVPPVKTRFKKGHSGNPNGRPKKIPALEDLLTENMTEEKDGFMAVDIIIKKLRQKAIQGDQRAIEYLLDRMYGKPKSDIKVDSEVNIIFSDELKGL